MGFYTLGHGVKIWRGLNGSLVRQLTPYLVYGSLCLVCLCMSISAAAEAVVSVGSIRRQSMYIGGSGGGDGGVVVSRLGCLSPTQGLAPRRVRPCRDN